MSDMQQYGVEIERDAQVGEGVYSNLALITHSTSEFILDFATVMPGLPKARIKSRVILTPEHAKRLLLSLQENISRYETNVGRIDIPQHQAPVGFTQKLN